MIITSGIRGSSSLLQQASSPATQAIMVILWCCCLVCLLSTISGGVEAFSLLAPAPLATASSQSSARHHRRRRVLVLLSSGGGGLDDDDDDDDEIPFALRDTSTSSSSATTPETSTGFAGGAFDPNEVADRVRQALGDLELPGNLDLGSFADSLVALKDNLLGGTVGERGEAYVAAQFAVILSLLLGGVPFVGDFLMLLLGPGLLLAGLAVMIVSVSDMGSALSPWPVPPAATGKDSGKLVTTGLFGEMRHPIYSGLLAFCAGLSIVSDSANRLLLTAVLLYVLDVKTSKEEEELVKAFPGEYEAYRREVPGKFFPKTIAENLPWMQQD